MEEVLLYDPEKIVEKQSGKYNWISVSISEGKEAIKGIKMEPGVVDERRQADYCLLYQKHRQMTCVKSCKKQVFQLLS